MRQAHRLLGGLEVAHAKGVWQRDLKPENMASWRWQITSTSVDTPSVSIMGGEIDVRLRNRRLLSIARGPALLILTALACSGQQS